VKQVAVLGDEVEFTEDERDVDPDYLDFALNEWDTYATEEALRIVEAAGSGEVVVVSVGDEDVEDCMRRCLAMGADRGIRVDTEEKLDPIQVARTLAEIVEGETPDLVLTGVQSSDSVQAATGGALAALLDLPSVAVVTLSKSTPLRSLPSRPGSTSAAMRRCVPSSRRRRRRSTFGRSAISASRPPMSARCSCPRRAKARRC
jgi:electron transfer flavoprotein beta subunit